MVVTIKELMEMVETEVLVVVAAQIPDLVVNLFNHLVVLEILVVMDMVGVKVVVVVELVYQEQMDVKDVVLQINQEMVVMDYIKLIIMVLFIIFGECLDKLVI